MTRSTTVGILVLAVVALGGTAWAKTPPFEMIVTPSSVAPGESVTVTITLQEGDSDFSAEDLTGLVGVAAKPSSGATLRPLSGHIEVPLPRVRAGVYAGTFTAPDELGDYVVVPFPTVVGFEGSGAEDLYPEPATIAVVERSPFDGLETWSVIAAVGVAGLVLVGRRRQSAGHPRL